jgi:FtsP/CotA-like multicopper oxidase with cupredoxin domain
MRASKTNTMVRLLHVAAIAAVSLLAGVAQAAAPGIQGTTFNLDAAAAYITQPDGSAIYSWGYGCTSTTGVTFVPAAISGGSCPTMQLPGPTLIVPQGAAVTVNLTNNLGARAGNTSILFPGFTLTSAAAAPVAEQPATCATPATAAVQGLLTMEAVPGCTVRYTFTASSPGTRAYYSGSQSDLQIEMGLYGAIIVLPRTPPVGGCPVHNTASGPVIAVNGTNVLTGTESDFRLSRTGAAYPLNQSCYDREYLFQFSEMDPRIHRAVEEIVQCTVRCPTNMDTVATEPYVPAYFLLNGRSMPDDMDPNYATQYPHQPYNGNPHMHPGELVLLRIIGQGRWQHPFHEHGNHVRVLARDGNLLLAPNGTSLAGPLLFTTTTTPGQAMDGIFQWTGKGLNWDVFGHGSKDGIPVTNDACVADINGYYTNNPTAPNYYEWCGDHNKPLENKPFGSVGSGGPVTLPDPAIVANGPWYGGSPYLGGEAMGRAVGATPIPPSGTVANSPTDEAGFAFMWHSHNEREITTNNIFPGGMLMMMLVDPRAYVIDESK